MKPAVVQIVQELAPPGGIQVVVMELRQWLAPRYDVHIVSLEGQVERLQEIWPRVRSLGNRLHGLDKPQRTDPKTILRMIQLLREISPIAVHTHHIGPLLYGGLAARLIGVRRLVHTEHDAWHLCDPRRRRLQSAALRLLQPQLVADARQVAEALTSAVPFSRPRIILNGVDTEKYSPGDRASARRALGLPEAMPLIGTVGRLEHVKGHDLMLRALAELPPDVSLAIAGDGSCRAALEQLANRLGVSQRVRFFGHIDQLESFYRALDLLCLPSRAEGLPLAILEAQACGIPIVATDVGAVREVAVLQASWLVPPDDHRSLASGIVEMLGRMPQADPRPFVVAHHDVRHMARSYEALFTA